MSVSFTQFRADLFTSLHRLFDITSTATNGLLLYLIVTQTSKAFRSYAIILASVTLSELFLGLSVGLSMVRVIPVGWSLAFQFHGICRKIGSQFCVDVHAVACHCVSFGYSLIPVSFWYRHYVLSNLAPKPQWIALICFCFYIPAFIAMITFAKSTSEPQAIRQILVDHWNISLYPDDPQQAVIAGYESIFQKTTLFMTLWICLPVFPGYTMAIIYRTRIMRILKASSMSERTKDVQKKLIKALTIQAIVPLLMMSQATIFLWRQFQLPFGESIPYFEEWVFLSLAIVSSINPCFTVYYVLPYRQKVLQIFALFGIVHKKNKQSKVQCSKTKDPNLPSMHRHTDFF